MQALFCFRGSKAGEPTESVSCFPKEFLHHDE
jgi:hypothetical protein